MRPRRLKSASLGRTFLFFCLGFLWFELGKRLLRWCGPWAGSCVVKFVKWLIGE